MGIELEFKLAVSSPELLETILFDPQVKEVRRGDYQLYHMATIYYDTPDRRLGTLRWTLRLRQENNTLVATLKTPAQGNIRGEWSCQAANIREAVPVPAFWQGRAWRRSAPPNSRAGPPIWPLPTAPSASWPATWACWPAAAGKSPCASWSWS